MTTLAVAVEDREILAILTRLSDRLDDLTPVFEDIGAALESRVRQRFDLKEDPEGNLWAPWAPSTEERRLKEGRGSLLIYHGRLLDSVAHRAGRDDVEVTVGKDYASYHEFGTRKLPRRAFVFAQNGELADDDRSLVLDILGEYLADSAR